VRFDRDLEGPKRPLPYTRAWRGGAARVNRAPAFVRPGHALVAPVPRPARPSRRDAARGRLARVLRGARRTAGTLRRAAPMP